MLASLLLLVAASPSDYVERFEQALVAFDAGRFDEAARRFELAGELAPHAPVWRVHAAASLLRAGDGARAARHAHSALRRGYPRSDLRAIDARLVPRAHVPPDLAPGGAQPVLSFGADASLAPASGRFEGSAYLRDGRAWDLASGTIAATRRTEDWTVIGRATHADGRVEVMRVPRARRWDHVDGRVLDWSTIGEASGASLRTEPVRHLGPSERDRGFRLGLWCEGLSRAGWPYALGEGRTLGFTITPDRRPCGSADRTLSLDLDTFIVRDESGAEPQANLERRVRVLPEREREVIESALGDVTRHDDFIVEPEGLDVTFLVRPSAFPSSDWPRLIVLDLEAQRVVARTRLSAEQRWWWPSADFKYVIDGNLIVFSGWAGSDLAAFSTTTWEEQWYVPLEYIGANDLFVRGDLLLVNRWSGGALIGVFDLSNGERRRDVDRAGVSVSDMLEGSRLFVGKNWGELVVMDGRDGSTVLFIWFTEQPDGSLGTHAAAVDGTFDAPARTLRAGHVLHAGHFVPASELAPWIWDPLHVRSLVDDRDRAPRDVPVGR